ncbi:MAG: hypothetical protein ACJ73S_25535 [Mycobacteriales bacterium]
MKKIVLARVAAPAAGLVLVAGLAVWLGGSGSGHSAGLVRPVRPASADIAMRHWLLPDPPGATPSAAPTPTTGFEELVSPSAYSALFPTALAALPELRQYRCHRIAVRRWTQQDWPVRTDVLEFRTARDAAGYLAARQKQYLDVDSAEHTITQIAALPGGQLFTDDVGDIDGPAAVVLAGHGTLVMQLNVWQRDGFDLGTVADLARRQYARIDRAAPAPPAPARDHEGDLVGLLLPRPPGTEAWDNEPGVAGNVTVAQIADDTLRVNRTDLLAEFKDLEMDRGAVRTWTGDDSTVKIYVYHFGTDANAAGWAKAEEGTPIVDGHFGRVRTDTTVDENGDEQAIAAAQSGNLVISVEVWKHHRSDPAAAHDLLTQQLARL